MKSISRNENGTYTVVIHLKEEERKQLKKLAKYLNLNDFEAIKYSIKLVSWWTKNEIEPDNEPVQARES